MVLQTHHFRTQDGCTLGFRTRPRHNKVLLCLPGVLRSSRDFVHLADSNLEHTLVLPDYRGRGLSQRAHPRSYLPTTYLNDLRHLILACDLRSFDVLGVSLGGYLALGLALLMPHRVRKIVLLDVTPEPASGALAGLSKVAASTGPFDDEAAAMAAYGPLLEPAFPDVTLRTQALMNAMTRTPDGRLKPDWDPAIARTMTALDDVPPLWALFDNAKDRPVLSISGALSTFVTEDMRNKLAQRYPHWEHMVVPNQGHAPALIGDVLARLERTLS